MTKTFETGRTYYARSLCDWDCVFSFTIRARTAKTVTVDVHGKTVSRGVRVVDGVETFKPFGSYSMAAVIYAERELIGDETADQADARRRDAAKAADAGGEMSGDIRSDTIARLAVADLVSLRMAFETAKLQLGGEEHHEATLTVALIEAIAVYRFGSRWARGAALSAH